MPLNFNRKGWASHGTPPVISQEGEKNAANTQASVKLPEKYNMYDWLGSQGVKWNVILDRWSRVEIYRVF